jgi:hypothetical protein
MLLDAGLTFSSLPAEETMATTMVIRTKKTTKKDRMKPIIEAKTNLKNSFISGTNILSMQLYKLQI